jgi:hypothetical protein
MVRGKDDKRKKPQPMLNKAFPPSYGLFDFSNMECFLKTYMNNATNPFLIIFIMQQHHCFLPTLLS